MCPYTCTCVPYLSYLRGQTHSSSHHTLKGQSVTELCPRLLCISCSTQPRLKFILLINVKMLTMVDILTFISRINWRFWLFRPKISIYLDYVIMSIFMDNFNFSLSCAEHEKCFTTLRPVPDQHI